MTGEKIKLHRFSVETEWSGLATVSNILLVSFMIAMSSEISETKLLSS